MDWLTFRITDSTEAYKVSSELNKGFFAALAVLATIGQRAPTDAGIFSRLNTEDGLDRFFLLTSSRTDRPTPRQAQRSHALRDPHARIRRRPACRRPARAGLPTAEVTTPAGAGVVARSDLLL
jgi:hypothetical protein